MKVKLQMVAWEIEINSIFGSIFFSKMTPKTPERSMKDVIDAKATKNLVTIDVLKPNGETKKLEFEALDTKAAKQIVSKIKKLK